MPTDWAAAGSVFCGDLWVALPRDASNSLACRSGQSWEGIHVTVDASTTVAQCEHAAGYIAAVMRANIKIFGGYYRIWVSDSLPGHKLKVSVWYNHNTNGVHLSTGSCCNEAIGYDNDARLAPAGRIILYAVSLLLVCTSKEVIFRLPWCENHTLSLQVTEPRFATRTCTAAIGMQSVLLRARER